MMLPFLRLALCSLGFAAMLGNDAIPLLAKMLPFPRGLVGCRRFLRVLGCRLCIAGGVGC